MASIKKKTNKGRTVYYSGSVKPGLSGASLQIDLSGFFNGLEATQRRLENFKRNLAQDIIIPHFQRLVLKTPVWRGTARAGWYMEINGKKSSGGYNKKTVDRSLTKVANLFGKPRGAQYAAAWLPGLPAGTDQIKRRGEYYYPIATQMEYGKSTRLTRSVVRKASRLIDEEMKIETGGGPRSAQISKITIGNNTPYLRYLAGDPYDGSHKVWSAIKGGDPDFVRSGILSENRNWIGNQNRILKARLNKLVSGSGSFKKYMGTKEYKFFLRSSIVGDK